MERLIIRQLWNNRRKNGWILIELILVTYFLWGVMDPIYVLLSNKNIDEGYETKGAYCLMIGEYLSSHNRYRKDQDQDSIKRLNFLRIFDEVSHYPNVKTAVITFDKSFPNSWSYTGSVIHYDTLSYQIQFMKYYRGTDFFGTFGVPNTGSERGQPSTNSCLAISEDGAKRFFGIPEKAIGKSVWTNDSTKMYSIVNVFTDFKVLSTQPPKPLALMPLDELQLNNMPYSAQICFRTIEGISPRTFIEKFKNEMSSRMEKGNYYFISLKDFDTIRAEDEDMSGTTNTLRLQSALITFFLLCTFLGVAGTFWLRANARREEIGLRMALGSTRLNIRYQFFFESWLLTTIAWCVGLIIVIQRVYHDGFAFPTREGNPDLLQNQAIPHFIIVSMLVYFLLVLIAAIGTWIPAARAAAVNPVEALGDE
ncbi:FtsX-like permease family protein [uncultured Bacteroides sp.]|uniref:ABC transporter permease n=1 Tax=uncultured Bacteroides sp. TaxID=162156 RepID=UPI002AAC1404|nr:FtsX-like permease family protein [uncultured Bacteroides sp.]